ncbi:MAG: RAMP superfamily CRISPR-associated protein [Clostridiales bacterium]|jgi:hypothetical protein|nr:RAMP superfamily CRISPR-associated protein [Clostridiales bacterium]
MPDYRRNDDKFVNPYNFVSIGEKVQRSPVEYGDLTGILTCTLETLTPLFIPNTTNGFAFSSPPGPGRAGSNALSHSYDFYSYEDLSGRSIKENETRFPRPIIPGSALRGAIRSAYEAVTNSCLSTSDDENTLYRRTIVPKNEYGIIVKEANGTRVLYKADKALFPSGQRYSHKMGDEVNGGYFLHGEDFGGKLNDSIMTFKLDGQGKRIPTGKSFDESSEEWMRIYEVWRLYQQRNGTPKGVNQSGNHTGYENWLKVPFMPVFYSVVDNVYYISPACMTKEVFSRTVKSILKSQGEHDPCFHGGRLCDACRLFGMVSDDDSGSGSPTTDDVSRSSRIAFRDATPVEPSSNFSSWYLTPRQLPILSGPKVSATEFYMEDTGALLYNYDYDTVSYPRGSVPTRTRNNARLRGRKFYWHITEAATDRHDTLRDDSPNFLSQRTKVRPVASGKKFTFDIYFERLTNDELAKLVYTLGFGDRAATNAHKIGHGKPVGYGSARISVDAVNFFEIDQKTLELKSVPGNIDDYKGKFTPRQSTSIMEYLKLTAFEQLPAPVAYPLSKDNRGRLTSYSWFGYNKLIKSGMSKPSFCDALPTPLAKEVFVRGFEQGTGDKDGNRDAPGQRSSYGGTSGSYGSNRGSSNSSSYSSNRAGSSSNSGSYNSGGGNRGGSGSYNSGGPRGGARENTPPAPAQPVASSKPAAAPVTGVEKGEIKKGKVISINAGADGVPFSAKVDVGAKVLGTVNAGNLKKVPLTQGETRNFEVTTIRDDGGFNLKPLKN